MGFYKKNESRWNKVSFKPGNSGATKWVGAVVLSAVVGSGATLAMIPVLQNNGILNTASTDSSINPASPTSAPMSSVNVSVSDSITQLVKKVEPAVMGVVNYGQQSSPFSQQTQLQPTGVGTGVLFYKDGNYGYVVTNNHVVDGASKVEAVLMSGKHVNATVVATDPYTDLAVLKIAVSDVRTVTPVTFANSDSVQAGEPAVAIGTPMGLDFAESVTSGIISSPNRIMPVETVDGQQTLDYQSVIQTDAAINPGNSGGPLLNIQGEVIGINSSKIVAQGVSGMGFAIPANEVQNIANQLMKTGHAAHPALGVEGGSLSAVPSQYWPNVPVNYGFLVTKVDSSAAQSAGVKPNDVIVGVDGHSIKSDADLRTILFTDKPGQTVKLDVYRNDQKLQLNVKLTEMQVPTTTSSQSSGGSDSSGAYGQGGGGSTDPFGQGGGYIDPFGTGN
jgi:serine protease Do